MADHVNTARKRDGAGEEQLLQDFNYFRNQIYKHPEGGEALLQVYDDWAGKFMEVNWIVKPECVHCDKVK